MPDQPATTGRPYPRHIARVQGLLTGLHTTMYRLSGGRLGETLAGMPMLLLTTWGRRSGKLRTAPLLYLPIEGLFVIVASNGGAANHPTWWYNLRDRPEALVQIGPARGRVRAQEVSHEQRARFWPRLVELYPPYEQYQARTNRTIPVIALQPLDPELYAYVPARYREP